MAATLTVIGTSRAGVNILRRLDAWRVRGKQRARMTRPSNRGCCGSGEPRSGSFRMWKAQALLAGGTDECDRIAEAPVIGANSRSQRLAHPDQKWRRQIRGFLHESLKGR